MGRITGSSIFQGYKCSSSILGKDIDVYEFS
uniref:Uncharacterized protein n=1 Tax=Solanum lycopersicum TaxID=4081 RepID=A0A3Q7IJ19_SOLLC